MSWLNRQYAHAIGGNLTQAEISAGSGMLHGTQLGVNRAGELGGLPFSGGRFRFLEVLFTETPERCPSVQDRGSSFMQDVPN